MKPKNFKVRPLILCALLLLAFMPFKAMAQACTNPNANLGDFIYNNTHEVFQGCTQRGWMGFHQIPDCPLIGSTCADGTKYAGSISGTRLFVTPADQHAAAYWGTYNFTTGETSMTDGITNTNNLVVHVTNGDGTYNPTPDAAPNGTPNAGLICYNLVANGYSDWYLPARDELNVIYTNRVAIGGLSADGYWSSTENNATTAWGQIFTNSGGNQGVQVNGGKQTTDGAVRCVRR